MESIKEIVQKHFDQGLITEEKYVSYLSVVYDQERWVEKMVVIKWVDPEISVDEFGSVGAGGGVNFRLGLDNRFLNGGDVLKLHTKVKGHVYKMCVKCNGPEYDEASGSWIYILGINGPFGYAPEIPLQELVVGAQLTFNFPMGVEYIKCPVGGCAVWTENWEGMHNHTEEDHDLNLRGK